MKKIITILFLLLFFSIKAQTVNNVPLKDLDVDYFMIIGTSNFSGTKMRIMFDFGQKVGFTTKNMIVKDKNGKNLQLESMVDALNFVSKYGYHYVNWLREVKGNSVYYGVLVEKNEI